MIESKYLLIVSPQNDEYFSARFLGKASKLIGKRGRMFIGLYEYLTILQRK